MFMGDPGHTSRSIYNTSSNPGQVVNWSPLFWATGNTSVVISAKGTFFASTGSVLYRMTSDHIVLNRHVGNGSLVGTPAVGWNDSAYVGSLDMFIYCLDGNGPRWWEYNTSAPVWSSPTLVENRTLYVTSAGLISFNLNGNLNWRVLQNVTSRSSPAVSSTGVIYFGGDDGRLYAVAPNGVVKWSYPTGGAVRTAPSIDSEGNIHFGSDDGYVYSVNPDGTLVWSYDTGMPVRSSIGIRPDDWSMLLTGNGSLIALDQNGDLGWWLKLEGYNVTRSLAIDSQGNCYVGSDSTLYSVLEDGKVRWSYRISTGYVGSPAISKNGTVVFGSSVGLFELGHVNEGNELFVLVVVLALPLALCILLILVARRLRQVKTMEQNKKE
jgi:outer membrane protein assembly factor BamB